jgi:SulP family sulfate permease
MGGSPRADLVAGVTTAVVALPLALGFGVAAGLGARAGLVTAIIAGSLAAVFGGSSVQVSGPTGAMAVVLLPIVHEYGVDGVLVAGLVAGVILMVAGVLRLGRFVSFLPLPVVEGFTAGIAAVIALQQMPAALGVNGGSGSTARVALRAVERWVQHPVWPALLVTIGVLLAVWLGHRITHLFPASLVAVGLAAVVTRMLHVDVARIGDVSASLPGPALPTVPWGHLSALLPAALAIAALAGIESLLAATVADGLSDGPRHAPDRELFGQGVANVVVPLFGGMPATGAIARTAVGLRAGARSRLAAVTHSLVIAVVVLAGARLVEQIPLAALAGVLLATAARMSDPRGVLALARASRSAALVTGVTLATTVLLDLIRAVEIGVGVAIVLALRQVARSARLDRLPTASDGELGESAHDLIDEHVLVFRIDGALFFATAHRLLGELLDIADVRVVVLRLSGLTHLDTTGTRLLGETVAGLRSRGVVVLLSGARPDHHRLLETLGVIEVLGHPRHVFADVDAALAHARHHVLQGEHVTAG